MPLKKNTQTPIKIDPLIAGLTRFREDVFQGLSSCPKKLDAKYFYDSTGDQIFQAIMDSPDYYLTECELDIFKNRTAHLTQLLHIGDEPMDIIELGAGDGMKSTYLLKHLASRNLPFTYMPIDISDHILGLLEKRLRKEIPEIHIVKQQGEYFDCLKKAVNLTNNRKVILFLGSNIGNMELPQAAQFCRRLQLTIRPGDLVIIGFDLKKSPQTILRAYQDEAGLTAKFNKNMLVRINRELAGNFDVDQFQHYQNYDPLTGACRSYLISLIDQILRIDDVAIPFNENEPIHMEVSQKFSCKDINHLAFHGGFQRLGALYDRKRWFVDEVWRAK